MTEWTNKSINRRKKNSSLFNGSRSKLIKKTYCFISMHDLYWIKQIDNIVLFLSFFSFFLLVFFLNCDSVLPSLLSLSCYSLFSEKNTTEQNKTTLYKTMEKNRVHFFFEFFLSDFFFFFRNYVIHLIRRTGNSDECYIYGPMLGCLHLVI